jgi:hypothetical protein
MEGQFEFGSMEGVCTFAHQKLVLRGVWSQNVLQSILDT